MVQLEPGRVYRTGEFARFDSNPSRLVAKLVGQGRLKRLTKGLYYAPKAGAFGVVPPSEDALLEAYFGGKPFVRTGPSIWNALGLGSTAVEAVPLVYNTQTTGRLEIGGRRFDLRRVRFPRDPSPEYFVVDLLRHRSRAGVDRDQVLRLLAQAVRRGRFSAGRLRTMARDFGTTEVQAWVETAITHAKADPTPG